ncbi:MAG: hypothetical protein WA688_06955 [Thermoplasmata archaeon]
MRAVLWSAAVAGLLAVGMILVPGISSAHSSSSAGLDPELSPQVHHITLTSPNAQTDGYFGVSVAISGKTVVVGAPVETVSGNMYAGHAYTFKGKTGALISTLTSPNAQTDGSFGWSVAVSGTTVVVGAIGETASGYDSAGHSYVF